MELCSGRLYAALGLWPFDGLTGVVSGVDFSYDFFCKSSTVTDLKSLALNTFIWTQYCKVWSRVCILVTFYGVF